MKRKVIFGLMAIVALMTASCTSCDKKQDKNQDNTEVKEAKLNASHATATDREYMYLTYGSDYRWFEQCVLLKDFLDEENDGTIAGISNVFQIVEGDEQAFDVHVILISHAANGKDTVEVKEGFWVEDYPLNDEAIVLSFEQAYERVMQSNYPKPHSRHCVLRKEVGPVDANPQYIFGNSHAQLYVDAITGEVADEDPAFKGSGDFGKPLGEWP